MGEPGRKRDRLRAADTSQSTLFWRADGMASAVPSGSSAPEMSYASATSLAHRKRFAQFFTPPKVARLMAEWAITPTTDTVLDPAAGTGVLVRAALERRPEIRVTAFEKDPVILKAFLASQPHLGRVEPILADFLLHDLTSTYDAVVMNPPYLRHHDLDYGFDIFARFGAKYGLGLSRLSNSYLLFTLKAAMALKHRGRASVLIPSEWMNANFGAALKDFLVGRDFLRELVYFSNCSDVFDDALTTASVLFLERPAS